MPPVDHLQATEDHLLYHPLITPPTLDNNPFVDNNDAIIDLTDDTTTDSPQVVTSRSSNIPQSRRRPSGQQGLPTNDTVTIISSDEELDQAPIRPALGRRGGGGGGSGRNNESNGMGGINRLGNGRGTINGRNNIRPQSSTMPLEERVRSNRELRRYADMRFEYENRTANNPANEANNYGLPVGYTYTPASIDYPENISWHEHPVGIVRGPDGEVVTSGEGALLEFFVPFPGSTRERSHNEISLRRRAFNDNIRPTLRQQRENILAGPRFFDDGARGEAERIITARVAQIINSQNSNAPPSHRWIQRLLNHHHHSQTVAGRLADRMAATDPRQELFYPPTGGLPGTMASLRESRYEEDLRRALMLSAEQHVDEYQRRKTITVKETPEVPSTTRPGYTRGFEDLAENEEFKDKTATCALCEVELGTGLPDMEYGVRKGEIKFSIDFGLDDDDPTSVVDSDKSSSDNKSDNKTHPPDVERASKDPESETPKEDEVQLKAKRRLFDRISQQYGGITVLDIILSKRIFFSTCGHVYCGRCVKNIMNNRGVKKAKKAPISKKRKRGSEEHDSNSNGEDSIKKTDGENKNDDEDEDEMKKYELVDIPTSCPVTGCNKSFKRLKAPFMEIFS